MYFAQYTLRLSVNDAVPSHRLIVSCPHFTGLGACGPDYSAVISR